MLIDEGLELLSEAECRELLATGEIGRVGVSMGALPAIFPVNYRVIDGLIVFRTAPGSKLAAAVRGSIVAFEVDNYQLEDGSGWSVLAIGKADVVLDFGTAFKALEAHLEPLAGGRRDWMVRIEPSMLSGRRIIRPAAMTAWSR